MPVTFILIILELEIFGRHFNEKMEDSNWQLSGGEFEFIYSLYQLHIIHSANVLCPNVFVETNAMREQLKILLMQGMYGYVCFHLGLSKVMKV